MSEKLTNAQIIDTLKQLTALELSELVKEVEKEFGVTAAAPVAMGAPVEEEEKVQKGPTEVTVVIKGIKEGGSKVTVIKAVQAITGLGLMDAKKLVDSAPANVKEKVSPVEGDAYKKQLEEAGAEIEIK